MSDDQLLQFRFFMHMIASRGEFHHGGCRGADVQASKVASDMGWSVVLHEPKRPVDAQSLLARNRDIVNASLLLVAAPLTDKEQVRSGTWATVRYARSMGLSVVMLTRGER